MSESADKVRAGRSRRPLVAVTGAATGLGHAFAVRLAGHPELARVLAIDSVRPAVPGARSRLVDVREPALAESLSGVDSVVHLALDLGFDNDRDVRRSLNVRGTATVLTAAAAAGVRRVVLVTSAMVYGARADNPVPLAEDAPLQAEPEHSTLGDRRTATGRSMGSSRSRTLRNPVGSAMFRLQVLVPHGRCRRVSGGRDVGIDACCAHVLTGPFVS